MAEISDLDTTDASNVARFPENQAPGTLNDGNRALEGLLARAFKDTIDGIVTTGGSSTVYTAASNRTLSAYYDGLMLCLQFHTASGATPTLNVDAVGAQSLTWPDGTAIAANDIPTSSVVFVKYDLGNTNWVVMTSPSVVTPTSLALVIGANVQAWDDDLDDIAALTPTKGNLMAGNGTDWIARTVGTDGQVIVADSSQADGINYATRPFTESFVSADQTITSAGALTLAHGLSSSPKLVQLRLKCTSAENGYSLNDEVIHDGLTSQSNAVSRGATCVVDATNLNIRFASNANAFEILHKTTGARAALTNASWSAIFYAWA